MSEPACLALRKARLRLRGATDAWILPSPRNASKPCSRHLLGAWWRRMEEDAELPHVERMGWHSLRRNFATEYLDLPLKDLCALGGWKSAQTILTCYQHPDQERLRRALDRRQPVQGEAVWESNRR